jgi:hypothetical protein
MVVAGAALLEKNREAVNQLNVFPVPDGDTGTNMSMTMMSAVRELNLNEAASVGEAVAALAKGALRGARGNSGVILSQLYHHAHAVRGGAEGGLRYGVQGRHEAQGGHHPDRCPCGGR